MQFNKGDIVKQISNRYGEWPYIDLADLPLEVLTSDQFGVICRPIDENKIFPSGYQRCFSENMLTLIEKYVKPSVEVEELIMNKELKFKVGDRVTAGDNYGGKWQDCKVEFYYHVRFLGNAGYGLGDGDVEVITSDGRIGCIHEDQLKLIREDEIVLDIPTEPEYKDSSKQTKKEITMTRLFANFARFDFENPTVYAKFKTNCFRAMNSGHEVISPRTIVEQIRWEDPKFQMSNNHIGFYARKFIREYPQHDTFFTFKKSA